MHRVQWFKDGRWEDFSPSNTEMSFDECCAYAKEWQTNKRSVGLDTSFRVVLRSDAVLMTLEKTGG